MAQPSLIRRIIKLEDELSGPLFRRERNRTHLTDLGLFMQPHFESVVATTQAAKAQDFQVKDLAPLKFGVMSTIGPGRMIEFFDRMRAAAPSIELSLVEDRGRDLVDSMMAGRLDIALIGLPAFPDRLDTRPLASERYIVAFPRGCRFESMPAVPIAELDRENYVSRTHCEFLDHCQAPGRDWEVDVNIKYSTEREDWVQAMILAGMGCAVMPEHLAALPGIVTRALVEPEVNRTISLVTVAARRFSPSVETVIRLADRFDWNRAAGGT